jgi:hypothetical protein
MKRILVIAVSMIVGLATTDSMAQGRWGIDIRGSVAFPTQELGKADLNTGFGIEPTVHYRFMPHLGAYLGWGWHRFTTDNMVATAEMDVEETGYSFGLQFVHPIQGTSLSYFVRGGGVYNHIELENDEGNITADSGHGLGWQAEAGLAIPISEYWNIMPGVRYRALGREIDIENVKTEVDLNYVSVGVSFSRTLGN